MAQSREEGLVQRVVGWLRAGYPEGVPPQDYPAVIGILRRSLTNSELERVVTETTDAAASGRELVTPELLRERVADVVKGSVRDEDLVRVSARLAAAGWPLGTPDESDADDPERSPSSRPGLVHRVVGWLREGYPTGLPDQDFVPVLALLRRRLGDDEVREVAEQLVAQGLVPSGRIDIGTAIAGVTSELPDEADIDRVRHFLVEHGWPVDFAA